MISATHIIKKPAMTADSLAVFGYSLHVAVRGRTLQTPPPLYRNMDENQVSGCGYPEKGSVTGNIIAQMKKAIGQ